MIHVGLTGGIASGKSTVSRYLKKKGAFIIDADSIAHALIQKENTAYPLVVKEFGKKILDPTGEIDRKRLGKIIFQDRMKRRCLNRIVHPLVLQSAETEMLAISKQYPSRVIIFDAALLIESEAYKKMDWVLLVYVNRETQIARLMRRESLSREPLSHEEAVLRVDAQMSIEEKIPFSDQVIDNIKPIREVEREIDQIYETLLAKAASACSTLAN